jgi:hypothetical protein
MIFPMSGSGYLTDKWKMAPQWWIVNGISRIWGMIIIPFFGCGGLGTGLLGTSAKGPKSSSTLLLIGDLDGMAAGNINNM